MILSVYDILKSQNAVLHDDGLAIYDAILKALSSNKTPIEVSFEGVKRCTTLFLNASFGKLLAEKGEDFLKHVVYPISHTQIASFQEKYSIMWDNVINKDNYQAYREEAFA
jgi:hypothetical protein